MSSPRRPSGTSIRIAGRCTVPRGASISGSACPRCSSPSRSVFHKILIANRGEIALRIMRTCREMGIRTVLAHSTADAQSLPVRLADETICIGPDAARASYLNMPAVISAAVVTDSEAIHPGYGFLAENPTFADICRASGLTFIGPSPEAIRLMGDKAQARMIAKQAGVPVVPGSELPLRNEAGLQRAALLAAAAVNYVSAGTVEFLVDAEGGYYFIEMNTRIQVEHPVTETITGLDLIREQIRIAAGEPLGYRQEGIRFSGHSIECRINAEDPDTFVPSAGRVTAWVPPGGLGVRVDSHLMAPYSVPPFYDSLLGKIIVRGDDRAEAIGRMRRALRETVIEGVKTTIPFHLKILSDPAFVEGRFTSADGVRLHP